MVISIIGEKNNLRLQSDNDYRRGYFGICCLRHRRKRVALDGKSTRVVRWCTGRDVLPSAAYPVDYPLPRARPARLFEPSPSWNIYAQPCIYSTNLTLDYDAPSLRQATETLPRFCQENEGGEI